MVHVGHNKNELSPLYRQAVGLGLGLGLGGYLSKASHTP